jgi:hypothetical protein
VRRVVEHFPDELRPEDYRERAVDRAKASASGVGAAVERDVSDSAPSGRRWECVVSDGHRHAYVRVEAPDLGPNEAVPPEAVEAAVERRAADGGIDAVIAQAPIQLSRADLAI